MDMEFEAIYANIQPQKSNAAGFESHNASNVEMEFEAIYANIRPKNRNTAGLHSQKQVKAQNSKRSRQFVVVTACIGLICVLLVVALILLYIHLTAERAQMNLRYMNLSEEYNKTLSSLTDEKDELQKNLTSMSQEKQELETRVKSLSDELMKNLSGSCRYYTSIGKKNWFDSRRFCQKRGEDLLIINTEEEQRYISSIVKERVWIGLSDTKKEGNMTWVDNTPLNKGFWYQGEPNDSDGNEDCVEILNLSQNIMNWNDLPCSHNRKWICEN